jgi:xylan 1,4-beta-xylosidase
MAATRFYQNPVLTGFFPDPSIIRVGGEYYMANSTFEYFPAIVISHSRDLIHWEIIGHGINRHDYIDLTGIDDSHGFWAPDISYYQGTYYIFATLRLNGGPESPAKFFRRQVVLKSDRPEGPYSRPAFIDIDGIDPSHFVDDDGAHYMVLSSGAKIIRLNDACTEAVAAPVTLWEGTGARCPEGPHLLRKDGYYYLILAEGGTGYGHRISVARSRTLTGPYEPCPYNPVMTQTDPCAKIQRAGHGKLVQTQHGDWWMVYLCGRPNEGNFCTLGRETALDPVRWTDDGWFLVNEGKGPSESQVAPNLPEQIDHETYFDDFNSEKLGLHWQFPRNPDNGAWSLTERPGYFRIWTGNADLGSKEARNVLLRREKHHHYRASLKLEFAPAGPGEQAGLVCYFGIHCFVKLFLTYEDGFKVKLIENRNDQVACLGEITGIGRTAVYLKVAVTRQRREFYYSPDNQIWKLVGTVPDATFLSDEGVQIGKHHTGTMVGLYANNGGTGVRSAADFDWFDYSFEDNE